MNIRDKMTEELEKALSDDCECDDCECDDIECDDIECIPSDASWDNLEFEASAAEYQGRKVTLNEPFRTPKESKKFAVYVKNSKGNVVKVRFGSKEMSIKKDDPKRRKSFLARHKCSEKKDKTTPAYWACWSWRVGNDI